MTAINRLNFGVCSFPPTKKKKKQKKGFPPIPKENAPPSTALVCQLNSHVSCPRERGPRTHDPRRLAHQGSTRTLGLFYA